MRSHWKMNILKWNQNEQSIRIELIIPSKLSLFILLKLTYDWQWIIRISLFIFTYYTCQVIVFGIFAINRISTYKKYTVVNIKWCILKKWHCELSHTVVTLQFLAISLVCCCPPPPLVTLMPQMGAWSRSPQSPLPDPRAEACPWTPAKVGQAWKWWWSVSIST